jgi:Zn-dependent oligopeptidase
MDNFYHQLDLHSSSLPSEKSTSEIATEAAIMYDNFSGSSFTAVQHNLHHLAQADYASLYYCYTFSWVICVDMFTAFSKAGESTEKEVFIGYRKHFLEKGGSEDAAEMVKGFLGREYNAEAYDSWVSSTFRL